ncbi:MAG: type VI secretion system tube protein Hcp [Pseudomonadota bacterium]
MAHDMFLKVEGIKGESHDSAHKDEIDVLSWSWGATQSGTFSGGGGGGSGKVNFNDMSFTKYVDSSSHALLKHVATGKHIKEALLTVRKAGDKPLEYVKLKMTDCLISSVQSGASGGEDRIMESISFNFAEFEYIYTPQKADGSGDSALPFKFSIKENIPK